jgi:hypothetical protein
MPKNSAEYQREYRARKKREAADRESVYALERGSIPDSPAAVSAAMHGARRDKEKKAELAAMGELAGTMPPFNVHAACDKRIALLERRLADCAASQRETFIATVHEAAAMAGVSRATLPGFLAAPDDDCPSCGHDRHVYNHLRGPCQCPVAPRRKCLCNDYDLGFE